MYIQSFRIQNFKSFQDVTFHFNDDVNILTGVNNSGKTSVLEALSLWGECFEKLIREVKVSRGRFKKGDFVFGGDAPDFPLGQRYIPFQDFISVRGSLFNDIFYLKETKEQIILTASLIAQEGDIISIPFEINAGRGSIYTTGIKDEKTFDYQLFNIFFDKKVFPMPIQITYVSPIATIPDSELFVTQGNIRQYIRTRQSVQVLRNRLSILAKNASSGTEYASLMSNIAYILYNDATQKIEIKLSGDIGNDTHIDAVVKNAGGTIEMNLSMFGSGMLQIIEILLSFYENKKALNLILLDEPDSHIHREAQMRLLEVLSRFTHNTQIFIVTHNENLIRGAKYEWLFHIEPKPVNEYRNILHSPSEKNKVGLQPARNISIVRALSGNMNGLDFISALECDKLILTEGDDDYLFIQSILNHNINNSTRYMYWALGGVDEIYGKIMYYKDLFSLMKNEKTLWEKSVLIMDKDYMTDKWRIDLEENLNKKLGIPVFIWESYTIESTLLAEKNKFVLLLKHYLGLEGIAADNIIISELIEKEILNIIEKKKELQLNHKNFNNLVNSQFSRLEEIEKSENWRLKFRFSRPTEILDFSTQFKSYFEQVNTPDEIHKIANKEEVAQIIHAVFSYYGKSFSKHDFPLLFNRIAKNMIPTQWERILRIR